MRKLKLPRKPALIVLLAIGLVALWLWIDTLGSFRLHSRLLHYPLGHDLQAAAIELSPDGRQIAILERSTLITDVAGTRDLPAQQDRIAILDIASDRQIATIAPPPGDWNNGKQLSVDQSLRYCDNGNYILALIGIDTLFAFRSRDFTAQTAIRLRGPDALKPQLQDPGIVWFGPKPPPSSQFDIPGVHSLTFSPGTNTSFSFQIDCAKASPFLVINGDGLVKVINIETGEIKDDISDAFKSGFGQSTAISPDGSRLAEVELCQRPSCYRVGVADVHTGKRIYSADLGIPDGAASIYQLVFAGNHTLLAAEKPSDQGSTFYDGGGSPRTEYAEEPADESWYLHNTIRAFDLNANGKRIEFSQFGHRATAYISASTDGKVILGRSSWEFRHRRHSLSSVRAVLQDRIVFWSLESGQQIAQSPSLSRDQSFLYPFLDLDTGGLLSGSYFQNLSEIRMSDDGKSAISYMTGKDQIRFFHWN